jgi:hypothetical protein
VLKISVKEFLIVLSYLTSDLQNQRTELLRLLSFLTELQWPGYANLCILPQRKHPRSNQLTEISRGILKTIAGGERLRP